VTNLAQYLAAPVQWPQLRPGINRLAGTEALSAARGYNKIDVHLARRERMRR
jgi:hypothetical protein